jgi:tRNA 2-thiouridine synthesizing protein B
MEQMLYTVNKSPLTTNSLDSALRIAPPGDPIMLYEDGVYAALHGSSGAHLLIDALADRPIYALQADLEARGIRRIIDGVQIVDYSGFVELVEQHDVAPWL